MSGLFKVAAASISSTAPAGSCVGIPSTAWSQSYRANEQLVDRGKVGFYERYVKRPLDCVLSTVAFLVLSPVMLGTAAVVRIQFGSPVLFTQDRPGRIDPATGRERIFKLYKFRTMTDEKDASGNLLPDEVRLTKVGKMLRSTSIDELPELLNIIKGDMAVVGPRPLLIKYLPYYTEEERLRHSVRPGLTGLAQISGRNFLLWDDRLAFDINYVRNITFLGDVSIILKTVSKVLKRADVAEKRIISLDQARSKKTGDGEIKSARMNEI